MFFIIMPSTVLSSFTYDAVSKTLAVTFRSGKIYLYRDVPNDLFDRMRGAFAKGSFFNRYIRGKYPFSVQKEMKRKG